MKIRLPKRTGRCPHCRQIVFESRLCGCRDSLAAYAKQGAKA